ncbi:MAG: hypothetical protein M1817_006643 [Caeruleum heppii]|nr:MAG: hypothetical protein M1817_006643 [Caeruleum heppii]
MDLRSSQTLYSLVFALISISLGLYVAPSKPISTYLFSVFCLLSGIVSYYCLIPPVPAPSPSSSSQKTSPPASQFSQPPAANSDFFAKITIHRPQRLLYLLAGSLHGFIALFRSSTPCLATLFHPPTYLCPRSATHLDRHLFDFNPYTTLRLALLLCACAVRLTSFHQLGRDFNFFLTPPSRLHTTGLYRYVRHPSYTALMVIVFAQWSLFLRPDGVVACWLPQRWLSVPGLHGWHGAFWAVYMSLAMWGRVGDEERMLATRFGGEWEAYKRRTSRFVPWVL